jgi:dUTPase
MLAIVSSLLFFLAGVVDEDYRGNVGVVLFNHSDKPFSVSRGDRIAQLICQQIYYPELQEVKVSIIQFYILLKFQLQNLTILVCSCDVFR